MSEITKIEPDNIKDSVVEIRFSSSYPNDLILGIIFEKLKKSFKVLKRDSEGNAIQIQKSNENIEFKLEKHKPTILHDEEISITLNPNALVFNCLNGYLLWPNYFKKIKTILSSLIETEIFDTFNRIGLRYINEYINKQIEDVVNFEFKFGIPDVVSDKFNFRTEFNMENHLVILNLIKTNVTHKITSEVVPVCYVDIDVINQGLDLKDLESLLKKIDEVHSLEKEIFFNKLLKPKFLESLKITKNG